VSELVRRAADKSALEGLLGPLVRERCSPRSRMLAELIIEFFADRPSSGDADGMAAAMKLAMHVERFGDDLLDSDVTSALLALDQTSKWRPTIPEVLEAIDRSISRRRDAERRAGLPVEPPGELPTDEQLAAYRSKFAELAGKWRMPSPALAQSEIPVNPFEPDEETAREREEALARLAATEGHERRPA